MSDKYVDSQRQEGSPARAHESSGADLRFRSITFETATADTTGDIRRLFTVGAHEIPVRMDIVTDGITTMSSVDVGLYRPGVDGVVVDADALGNAIDLSSAISWVASSLKDGLIALGIEERGVKSFFDIANDVVTTDVIGHLPKDSYDVALTYNTDVAEAETVTVHLYTIDSQ